MTVSGKKDKKIKQIASKVGKKIGGALGAKARTFTEIYFANVPPADFIGIDDNTLVDEVLNIWEFCQTRGPGEAKIRAYNARIGCTDCTPNKTIIEVVNDNMPFLVDSISGLVNSMGLSIHLLTHPVMLVERNKNGTLTCVHDRTENAPECVFESFIRCEINEPSSLDKIDILQERIASVLQDVRHSVEDWHKMTGKLYEAVTSLKTRNMGAKGEDLNEIVSFLEWAANHHFTFLGYCEYDFTKTRGKMKVIPHDELGLLRGDSKEELTRLFEEGDVSAENREFLEERYPLMIAKTMLISPVHRRDPLDCISIKQYDSQGHVVGMIQFFGLFTSVVYNRSTKDIPLLRIKVRRILEKSGFSEQWHDGKALLHILESFPRDELFQSSEEWLYETCMAILHLQNRQRMSLFVRHDQFARYVSCLIYVPRDRYDSELRLKMTHLLEEQFQGELSSWQTQLGELAFARVHFIIRLSDKGIPEYDIDKIEQQLVDLSLTWRDKLNQALLVESGEEKGLELFDRYGHGFSRAYQERFAPQEAVIDILEMEKAFSESCLQARLCEFEPEKPETLQLKIYSIQGSVELSDILPVFEKLNLRVLGELPFTVTVDGNGQTVWVHDFIMSSMDREPISVQEIEKPFLEAFHHVWCGEVDNDGFNRLVIGAGMNWRECQLIRAYAKYLKQLRVTFSAVYMQDALLKNPGIARNIIRLFETRFDPDFKGDREKEQKKILSKVASQLERIESLDEDRILNQFINCVTSTVRTNYFQKVGEHLKSYVSFKIDCQAIDEMPLPRPMYEIFVYSPRLEAVHMRGGKVARGGLRWSDRQEDFRTEILGLVKAQMVKNAVIVPTGSKGGFIVKKMPAHADRETMMAEVVDCYRTMISGMLDVTDNLVKGKVAPPKDVVRWDDDDPYLVVAADKGTATFSDFANEVSQNYNFWLGDAFASGGSVGYDHKKMGITARGAWESVKHHFREMGHDIQREDTTVIGVGDMSGDVFGNGMLLSKHLKLVAAFNHMHIFIDPNPDPAKSFKERERLFKLPRSTWMDYAPKLISSGGGVFDRNAKSLTLTSQMKALLGIDKDKVTPNGLIHSILQAEADLLWFGGIGTYVKAHSESNAEVGDRVNDMIRVDARDLQCKVIGEGANLGVTQPGRIEFALHGGALNTDAIDNSAGVDCSDHEVNIKILLGKIQEQGRLDYAKRNKQLESMTDEVAYLVLKDNVWQNQAISMAQSQGHRLLEEQIRFMHDLEAEGILDRTIEFLPDDQELGRRLADKQGLTRPELSVLLAYAKNALSQKVLDTDLPDCSYLVPKYMTYFPKPLQAKFEKDVLSHPLRREITTMVITNTVVNRMGITMVSDLERQTGHNAAVVVRAYLIVRELIGLEEFWKKVDALHGAVRAKALTAITFYAYKRVKRLTKWFLRYGGGQLGVETMVKRYKAPFKELESGIEELLSPRIRTIYEKRVREYKEDGIEEEFAKRLATLDPLWSALDIINIAQEAGFKPQEAARVYYALGESLNIDWLKEAAISIAGDTRWQQGASSAIVDDLMTSQKAIALKLMKTVKKIGDLLDDEGNLRKSVLESAAIENLMADLRSAATIDLPMLTIATRTLRGVASAA